MPQAVDGENCRYNKKIHTGHTEISLLVTLMVGFTAGLDPILLKYYADTGVIHMIAISGLPLSLICQSCNSLPQHLQVYYIIFCFPPFHEMQENKCLPAALGAICFFSVSQTDSPS
jgi:predicted membrane metal-binding protein